MTLLYRLMMSLFCNRPARNARPGIPCEVALHVIGRGVDHERSAAVAENGMGAGAQCVTFGAMTLSVEVPSATTVKFCISPAWGPRGFSSPCSLCAGLKWAPADVKAGGSHDACS